MNEECIHHYNALTMVYNILVRSSFLGPCPSSTDPLDTNTLCFSDAPNLLAPLD